MKILLAKYISARVHLLIFRSCFKFQSLHRNLFYLLHSCYIIHYITLFIVRFDILILKIYINCYSCIIRVINLKIFINAFFFKLTKTNYRKDTSY